MFLTSSYYSERACKRHDLQSHQNCTAYLFMCNKGSFVEPCISNF